ncbi:MAG: FecR domain-containing protein, partial [Panacibacter sp.]
MQEQSPNNKIWFLMSRSLSGEATAEEERELQKLIQQDTTLQQQHELMKGMWHTAADYQNTEFPAEEEKNNISRILQLARQESATEKEDALKVVPLKKKYRYLFGISSAAALLIIALSVWMLNRDKTGNVATTPSLQNLVTENGSRTRTILPDGSNVWLNAGSHISFSENFTGSTREVTLDGEAYFDVVKQPQRPFIVHVSGYDIRVLGTAFNVKSYPDDKTIETTLLRGLVQVTKHGIEKQQPVFLHPNEKLIVDKLAADDALKLPDNNKPEANAGN